MNRCYLYLLLLCLMGVITYLDRVCISVAGPHMQDALHISPVEWGWVGTAFLLGYALLEVPSGHWGDRVGARRVLTRIVLWWSLFTAITGTVSSYPLLLGVRFLFGAGEAGAFPTGSVAISRWFPAETRGRAFGLFMMSGQIGGALSPLLVIPIQTRFGWRASFFVFGAIGIVWAAVWFWQFRDLPAGVVRKPSEGREPWCAVLRSGNLWTIIGLAFGYFYTGSFYQTWFHTYLVKGRGFSEGELSFSALPYVLGAAANLLGGFTCDRLVASLGLKWSRRSIGIIGLSVSAVSVCCVMFASSHVMVITWLSLAYAGITFQQPVVFTACLDIGGSRGGAVTGLMNMGAQAGAAVSSAVYGYILKATGNYNEPLVPMALLLIAGTLLWMKVDVSKPIIADASA